ncbi:adhesion G-protein coupled receptor G5-like [Stylophora pistillata]|uniref:adhesion G-protein coupled receptor G5-like n=1 Tax=Stylophora pistillata TaxID=50429 RepID=UPI000C03C38B|nr:adhesion G-protein coupled receptor G5-like [Stylophora pistillata]
MGSVIVGCVYKDLHELLLTHQSVGNETDNTRFVNTRIMTADMDPKPEKLQQDVVLKFRSLEVVEAEKRCVFWSGYSKSPDGFTGEGCHVDSAKSNSAETVCRCNHLTYFAVLVDFDNGDTKVFFKIMSVFSSVLTSSSSVWSID